jgi:signal transduction histidine kinase
MTFLLAGARRPLKRALRLLAPRAARIDSAWRLLLRRLRPSRPEFEALLGLDLKLQLKRLRGNDLDASVQALEREGEALALRGVPEDHAVIALAFQLESCLLELLQRRSGERSLALALVRLTAAIQRFALAGYARARAAGWQRADEQERKRLSRDLHDEVGADLVALKLAIEMTALELRGERSERARARLEEALALVAHALDSVRRLTLDLGPSILEKVGLGAAVKIYGRQFAARTGIPVRVTSGELPDSIPSGHQATLYRVLQGALSNVAKHSKARAVTVALGCVRRAVLVLVIEDDGVGFDVRRQAARGAFGLTAMRDRIQSLGGRLHIESRTPGAGARAGTRIEIDVPLEVP